jgi:hypothetical protein
MGLNINVEQILDELLEAAKQRRASIPHSESEGMEQMIVFIGPNGEIGTQAMKWNDEREKYATMRAVSKVAKEMFCTAIVMISDTRFVDSDKFGSYFHMPPIIDIGVSAWQKEYKTILNGIYGGLIKNLPRELWTEAVLTVIKGPRIPCQSRLAPYVEGPNDSIKFIDSEDLPKDSTRFDLLPDWWD